MSTHPHRVHRERLLASLISAVRGRHLVVATAVYLPLATLMFGTWTGSLAAVSRACADLPPFDVRAWWTVEDARAMMTACGPAGRAAYVHQQLLDLAYPAVLAAVLLAATALLVSRYGTRWWPILLPTVAMTALDYVENVGVWTLLLDWPDIHPAVIAVAATATAVKRVLGFVAFSTPLLLGLAALAAAIRRRSRHDPAGPAASPSIRTVELSRAALAALAENDLVRASVEAGVTVPDFFLTYQWLWRIRTEQIAANPTSARWVVRAVVAEPEGIVVGHAGFHGPPDKTGMVEVAYSVDPVRRRRGYATAMLRELLERAAAEPGVRTVRASVSPDNAASLATIAKFGFTRIGEQWDEDDGLELIFEVPAGESSRH